MITVARYVDTKGVHLSAASRLQVTPGVERFVSRSATGLEGCWQMKE
jgi:hypothetical protein